MNNIYTYISSNGIHRAIVGSLVMLLGRHPKAVLLFVCLAFFAFGAPAHAQVTLSGTIYSDAGATPDGTVRTINVAVGTSTPGVFTTNSTVTTGAYSVTIGAGSGIAVGTPITVWIDGGTVFGSVVTKASSSIAGANITGLDVYRNRLITRHEGTSATSTTINDLAFYTIAQDADLTHAVTSNGEIVVRSGIELYIWGGDTFAPGGAITVAGNAGAGATEGSLTLGASSVYTAGGNLSLAGSLTVPSSATFNAGSSTIFFVASTTGKTISAPVTSIGNVTFVGNGGGWTFTSSATTSAFTILVGSVTAPSSTLAVNGTYQNYGTFNNNGGTMTIIGPINSTTGSFPAYTAGLDTSGSAAGTGNLQISTLAVSGNGQTLYAGKAGNATACSQTAGSAIGCELIVIDIANTSAPTYVAGRDATGDSTGIGNVAINYLTVVGNYLYVAKAGNATACSQTAGSATGCELMVFDISSTTNPVYVAGRDMDGTATGVQNIAVLSLAAKGTSLYVAKAASGATACSTTALNCELMVFDISSTTNPTYQTGRDTSGSAAGTQTLAINSLGVVGNTLVAGKAGSATACVQTAGSAVGCEIMFFDVSSTTNPTFTAGRDVNGNAVGAGNVNVTFVTGTGTMAYIAKVGSATACTQASTTASGCELMAFDITNSANPLFVRGVDIAGSQTGQQSNQASHLHLAGNYLYVSNAANATVCEQNIGLGIGCELTVFDVSSSSALVLVTGRDSGGATNGIQSLAQTAAVSVGSMLFVSRAGSATACSQTVGSAVGCELAAFSLTNQPSGILMGNMSGSAALGHVIASGTVEFRDVATTSNLTVSMGTTTFPSLLTVTGNFQNNANLVLLESTLQLDSASAQSIGGNLINNNELYALRLSGSGAKTFTSNASTTFLTVDTGTTATFPSFLSVRDTYQNNGTVNASASTLITAGFAGGFLAGVSAGGSATDIQSINITALLRVRSFVFAAKAANATACSQTAGSAIGCELMVFNIESGTSPSYRAGLDVSGSAAGTGNIAVNHMAVSTNNQTLYVAKAANATACSQTAGSAIGCELMVFDIASSTAPSYVAGRDVAGNSTGAGSLAVNNLLVKGDYLYVAKAADATACSQTAGSAIGCELMVFDISSTTNPVYVAGRDADGTATGANNISMVSMAVKNDTLYITKGASGGSTACSSAVNNCELMVFDIASSTNPTYVTGRDASGSAGGVLNSSYGSLSVAGDVLVVAKANSGTACSQTAGSATGCEIQMYDISSTTNPTYVAGRDVSGDSTGTGNLAVNFVAATGTQVYVAKAGSATACSQTAGSALGCEVMVFSLDTPSNPTYVRGIDSSFETDGELNIAVQTLLPATSSLMIGRAGSAIPCEQTWNLRLGCELVFLKMPTTLSGAMIGSNQLGRVTTYGLTEMTATASTSNLTIASSSVLTVAPAPLSISGNFINGGEYRGNLTPVTFTGTNIQILGNATTTFYDLTQTATTAATTTFSGGGRYIILRNLVLQGVSTSTPLRLQSNIVGTQWRIDTRSSTTITAQYLAVSDSNNISTTTPTIICSPGCADRGNNTNWSLGAIVTITGIVYGDYGSTPLASSVPIRLLIGSESPTAFSTTTTAGTGAYTFSVTESLLSTSTKYVLYIDNDASNKANLLSKGGNTGVSLTGLDLYKNFSIFKHETTGGTVTGADAGFYDGVDDTDILYRYAANQLETNAGTSLVVWDNTQFSPDTNVVINGNGTGALNDGNLFIRSGGTYTAGGDTTIGGSLRASSTASYVPGAYTTSFVATTSGQVVDQRFASLGNVAFSGGGAWTFSQAYATTTDFKIDQGTVTAPSDTLAVTGIYRNHGTFTNNSGTVYLQGTTTASVLSTIATYGAGVDGSGSLTGTDAVAGNASVLVGNYLYVVKAGSATACSQSAGSATGCELLVFDVSNPASPVYVAGRDTSGDSTGVGNLAMNYITAANGYLYVAKASNATACSQSAGSAIGCELMVFDISSSTNPVYVAGRDVLGDAVGAGGIAMNYLAVSGNYLYAAKAGNATACAQTAGSAIGCELMVFDISNPLSPTYVAGRDITGDSTGVGNVAINALVIKRSSLYIAKAGNATACSQTAGSATGCELIVFDISSTTNPTFVAGRDASGDSTGILNVNMTRLGYSGNSLYASKAANATACSQTAGSAIGCELMVFDIASTTNPSYVAGRDAGGDAAGTVSLAANSVAVADNYLYVSKAADATACFQTAGSAQGCELMVFDISSTTNPNYIVGADASGSSGGTGSVGINHVMPFGSYLYIAKAADATACSQTAGSAIGCEFMVFTKGTQPSGYLTGLVANTNKFTTLRTKNFVYANNNGTTTYASTTNLVIDSGSTFTAPTNLTITGDYSNDGIYISPVNGTVWFDGNGAQSLSGSSDSQSNFGNLIFTGSGVKTLSHNATSSDVTISTGATLVHSATLTIAGDYYNQGTFTDSASNLRFTPELPNYISGVDANGSLTGTEGGTFAYMLNGVTSGNYLYVTKNVEGASCSQSAGLAQGCSIQVYDMSSTTNPVYVAGRTLSGDSGSATFGLPYGLAVSGNYLYVSHGGDATACSQTAGSAFGCELLVFDISSSTNPVYVAGRDASGDASGISAVGIRFITAVGNYLYVAKDGNATACSQTAGLADGCELMVFDISSSTNPVYVAGRDSDGSSSGTSSGAASMSITAGGYLYLSKLGNPTACSQTAGSAVGCELMVFDISSSTNPVYVAGRDASGDASGISTGSIYKIATAGGYLYLSKLGNPTACSQTAGSAVGCELMVFDISSSTNPVYVAGRDSDGSSSGITNQNIQSIFAGGNSLYISKDGNATACSQTAGSAVGCELMVFDISSSTNPVYMVGLDSSGSTNGTSNVTVYGITKHRSSLYLFKNTNATACSQVAGSAVGCELMTFDTGNRVDGAMVGVNALGTVTANGYVLFGNTASTSNIVIEANGTIVAPTTTLTTTNNFTNNGSFDANNGTVELTGTNQTLTSSATTTFYNLTKNATTSATTTFSATGAFVTTGALQLNGTVSAPLALRSTASGSAWTILPLGQTAISYVNVKDSRNSSTTIIDCAVNCVDSGNNINWSITPANNSPAPTWDATNWVLYDKVTLDAGKIDEDLTDFPVYINLADLSSNFWSTTPSGSALVGTDIRVTTDSGAPVELPRELVFASSTLHTGELHFRANHISAATNTSFRIYYNGTTTGNYLDTDDYGANNVWTNGYVLVHHLNENGNTSAGGYKDSTGNAHEGTGVGMTATSDQPGRLGTGQDFSTPEDSQYIDISNSFTLGSSTLSAWYKVSGGNLETCDGLLFSRTTSSVSGINISTCGNTTSVGYHWNDTASTWGWDTGPTLHTDVWNYVALSVGSTAATAYNYSGNNFSSSTNVTEHTEAVFDGLRFGDDSMDYRGFIGSMDEVRIASNIRSTAWIKAEYINQATTTDFYTVGNFVVGSTTLTDHTTGQTSNAFSHKNKSNETLYQFKLIPQSGTTTVSEITFRLTGVLGVTPADFSNIRLLRDADADGDYDASDGAVGGTGQISITNGLGTITFTTAFDATTTLNYILIANWNALPNGSFVTIQLRAADITAEDIITGAVTSIQHGRNNKGGGGGGASSAGDPAPAGAGTVGGGGTTGGEVIGNDPDYFWPGSQSGSWTSGASAYDQTDSTYATTNSVANHQYADHSLVIPGSNSIQGIIVKLELSGTTGAGTVDVQLSWDGGTSWTATKSTPTLGTSDVVYTLGSPSDVWGRSWSVSDFSNANFRVRVIGNVSSNTIRLDAIQVRVYHVAGGGGGGGGGAI